MTSDYAPTTIQVLQIVENLHKSLDGVSHDLSSCKQQMIENKRKNAYLEHQLSLSEGFILLVNINTLMLLNEFVDKFLYWSGAYERDPNLSVTSFVSPEYVVNSLVFFSYTPRKLYQNSSYCSCQSAVHLLFNKFNEARNKHGLIAQLDTRIKVVDRYGELHQVKLRLAATHVPNVARMKLVR
eukprot:CAMPEP_0168525024 /NCGR_PEP_ID=MMETSP0405-20121227/11042_1 /TAXON_ID=498012 /ORGANISM="Trichosphaerium sp, Strain Am-I-7 wt" /LENGTH=182 /DNA_ID=CAMNT_0008547429 /DNA_START=529 /DNA_END=1077 /DNA_ORIENTATION=-